MLKLQFKFIRGDSLKTIDAIFRNASEIKPILRRWGGYLRGEAKKTFADEKGWEPLAESTLKKLQHTRTSKVTTRGRLRASYVRRAEAGFKKGYKKDKEGTAVKLDELRKLARGNTGDALRTVRLERIRKQIVKAQTTGKRVGGDSRAAEKHKLLGGLRSSLSTQLKDESVVVESRAPWSDVHNSGGSAGHGSKIPERTFLDITEKDAEMLSEIAVQQLMSEE